MTQTIALTIYRFIKRHLSQGGRRKFFRVDGFEDATYKSLIKRLEEDRFTIDPYTLVVRSTAPIEGFESFAVEVDRSATWYRNHVSEYTALVLLFNRPTSDAQSLKDLYTITETTLANEGIDDLFTEVFHDYQLMPSSNETLKQFLRLVERNLFKPQLRDVADFLEAVKTYKYEHHGVSIDEAIANSLPALGMFRFALLATMDKTKSIRTLKEIYRASRLGAEMVEDRQIRRYIDNIEKLRSTTNSGLTENAIHLIKKFLTTIISSPKERKEIYALDWEDVGPVFQKSIKKQSSSILKNLEQNLRETMTKTGIEVDTIPKAGSDFLEQLGTGLTPSVEEIEQFTDDYGDIIGPPLKKKLSSLMPAKTIHHSDFMIAVVQAAVAVVASSTKEFDISRIIIRAEALSLAPNDAKLIEAIQAFHLLYGGIEQLMPGVQWDLESLDTALAEINQLQGSKDASEHNDQRLLSGKTEIKFEVRLVDAQDPNNAGSRADVVWTYLVNGAQAVTMANLQAEYARIIDEQPTKRLPVPLYEASLSTTKIADFDLSQPLKSIGTWYENPRNLQSEFMQGIEQQTDGAVLQQLERAILRLERTWARVIDIAANNGFLAVPLDELLAAYTFLIDKAGTILQSDQEHVPGLRTINRAWLIGPQQFDDWAIVPFLHPLKIQWWHSRAHAFNELIQRLLDPEDPAKAVDQDRLVQEIESAYSSTSTPPVLALTQKSGVPEIYMPVQEFMGYELYRVSTQASIAHGFAPELSSDTESDQTVKQAAIALAAVVEDYIETYPFVRDGLEIYIIRCRNGALPGALVEQINRRLERNNTRLRLNIIVHTDRGAPIHEHVTRWLQSHEEFQERFEDTYFPRVSLKVRHCTLDELFESVEDTDMVILPDVIAERGQKVKIRAMTAASTPDSTYYLSRYGAYQTPHQQKEFTRDIVLTDQYAPYIHQSFYRLQDATYRRGRMHSASSSIEASMQVTLQDWQQELGKLHSIFNWVVCYDAVVDRFLLEATFPQAIDVIRYSLGLGPKRRHNLTVSSSNKTRSQVQRRLMTNLKGMLGAMPYAQQQDVAEQLILRANRLSGDIVLRAAGPGAFLNELIGMVAAKAEIEQAYNAHNPEALTTWIYLEDFSQWFKKRLPDLLFVAIKSGTNTPIELSVQVIETKCVSTNSFPIESHEARDQVIHGLNRLQQVWQPGSKHLDAAYWYDQLYQALAGTISLPATKVSLWEQVRQAIPQGAFELEISAHTYVFCHDGEVDQASGWQSTGAADTVVSHHYGRQSLRNILIKLIHPEVESSTLQQKAPSTSNIPPLFVDEPVRSTPPVDTVPVTTPTPNQSVVNPSIDTAMPEPSTPEPTAQVVPIGDPNEIYFTQGNSQAQDLEQEPNVILRDWIEEKRQAIMRAMRHYNINIAPIDSDEADIGPSIVRFKLRTRPGEKLNRIQAIAEDLQRELALSNVPIIDNVPGTNYIGLDIPRLQPDPVELLSTLSHLPPAEIGQLHILAGKTPNGEVVVANLTAMPHMLVAGTTGSGKTVFLYSIIVSLLEQFGPDQLELLLVDPKQTDFVYFEGIPHLFEGSVIIEPEEAIEKLKLLTSVQLEERTSQLRDARCRDIQSYNATHRDQPMKPIVVIIDEYADLVQVLSKPARQDFESQLVRLAQRARNVGIHLVVATQRPSADVLTTMLKTNLSCRVAFRLPSHHDSQIVLDRIGAENLIGKGDMLFIDQGYKTRLQGLFIQNQDLEDWVSRQSWISGSM